MGCGAGNLGFGRGSRSKAGAGKFQFETTNPVAGFFQGNYQSKSLMRWRLDRRRLIRFGSGHALGTT